MGRPNEPRHIPRALLIILQSRKSRDLWTGNNKVRPTTTPLYFGHFVETGRPLELLTAVGTPASLLSFICAFLLIEDLAIAFPDTTASGGDQGKIALPASTSNFKGKLKLLDMFHESDPIVEQLCALPLPFHTISISSRATGR